ncbi:peptidoglycan-binding protein [Geoalkalibacter halelectricus]|uniref:Peptidoglycan-binding protein n=1 Tax=Geoalkalibacter halelectricus TaxID=2847045 RepID=A0ABY5ZP54_9BACT|nr:peptidoglycan-binding protein [Geoalkalibacter halelectricus]MDO3379167.1 peptidoglycan-binding protein [Geoalkalibacter halelectricus]UWZ80927.1 peptidoglycan-binding protein [Geoalkalibacter halelectricus]
MSLRPMLDDIELQQVQFIDSDQDQILVGHRVPALEGDFWQGLGRRAGGITLAGVLTGAEAGEGLNNLREKFHAAAPVSFVADIAAAVRVDQVLIESMEVREIAGRPLRFEYLFRLREYIPVPPPRRETPPPPPPPPPSPDVGILEVEVLVEGQPEFDHAETVVTVEGEQEDGTPLSRTLTNRSDNVWREEEFPPGAYTCRARVEQPQLMTGEASAAVRAGETTRALIRLRPGGMIAKAFVVHFWFDKAFIEPCLRGVLRRIAEYAANHADEKMVIVGHTDLVGSDVYNQSLSERRGRAVYAWLTAGRDPAASRAEWENLRRARPVGQLPSIHDTWAVREYQFILSDLDYYKASIDEDHGPLTSEAVRNFQLDQGLPQTGQVNDTTWSALIAAYLDQDRLAVPENQLLPNAGDGCSNGVVKWLGGGEKDPVRNTQDAWRPNRRTEILFVRAAEFPCAVPQPVTWNLPSPGGDWCVGPGDPNQRTCFVARGSEQPNKWLVVAAEPGQVTVDGTVTRPDGSPVGNEPYALMAPDGEYLHTDAAGRPDLGERPSGPQRGRPIPNRTATDGSFRFPDPRPEGTYILHLLELRAPAVARLADAPPQTARGNFVCRRLEAGPTPPPGVEAASPARDASAVVEPTPAPPVTVNPTLTLARTLVVVKKSHTDPARVQVTLATDAPFNRTGTLTRSSNAVRFFTAASGGTEITFNGTDNVFTGARLSAGVQLFAEGATASTAMDDVQLTLTLAAGSTPIGPPALATMTAVELTLDIADPRPAPGTAPPQLPQPPPAPGATPTDKWFGGRLLNAQDPDNRQERALVTLRPVQPAAFTGTLTLRNVRVAGNTITGVDNKLQLFDNEQPTAGEVAKNNPHELAANTIPAAGLELFAEGRSSSANLRDTGLQIGIKDVEADGDRVAVTVGVTAQIAMPSTVVLVKKPHTSPARRPITLRTNVAFGRNGTLTRSSNAIRFFTAAAGGTEITFNGADNVFTGAQLTAGVQVFAEGASASAAMDDFRLTLTLAPGNAPPAGRPTTANMTAVELTLDIFATRTLAGTDPAPLPQPPNVPPAVGATPTDKWFGGRFVHLQDASHHHGRALVIVRQVRPATFTGTLTLRNVAIAGVNVTGLDARARLFDTEQFTAGEAAKANPHEFAAATVPAAGLRFFAEGRAVSAALRDTALQLGIKDLDDDGDRVRLTVVRFRNLSADIPSTPAQTPRLGNSPVARHNLSRATGALAAADFDEDFTTNPPLVLLHNAVRAADPINLSVQIEPAGVPVSWSVQRDTRAVPNGDHAGVIALSPNPAPTLTPNGADRLRATLITDAVGSFHVRPFVDIDGNGQFDHNIDREPFIILNTVLVHASLHQDNSIAEATHFVVNNLNPGPPPSGIRVRSGVFAIATPNTAALKMTATLDLVGGGNDGTRGLDRVFAGWINNQTAEENIVGTFTDSSVAPPVNRTSRSVFASNRALASGPDNNKRFLPGDPVPILVAPPLLDSGRQPNPGSGGNTATLSTSRITSRTPLRTPLAPAAVGERLLVEAVDSPGDGEGANHPGFPAAQLVRFQFGLTFKAFLSLWTNLSASIGATGDPADRLYSVLREVDWDMEGEWTLTPATGAITEVTAPRVSILASSTATPPDPAETTDAEIRPPTGLSLLARDARA